MNEGGTRGRPTTAVHGAGDESRSSQLTVVDPCDLNRARRESRRTGKKSQGSPANRSSGGTGIRLSVDRPDQETLNNSSTGSSTGLDDSQQRVRRVCAALLHLSYDDDNNDATRRKATLEANFTPCPLDNRLSSASKISAHEQEVSRDLTTLLDPTQSKDRRAFSGRT